jgi:TolA-binding protein
LSRGTLDSVKVQGTVYVLIDSDMARHIDDIPTDRPGESDALISQMQGRIESLERQLERAEERDRENRRIIAALTSRIPAIEAPQDVSEAPQTAQDSSEGAAPRPDTAGAQEGAQRPWWRRVFGS